MSHLDAEQIELAEHEAAMENAAYPVCFFCGRPVEHGRDWRRVHGWVKSNGADGFRRDGYGEEWAHRACIDVNKTVGLDQGAFF